MKGYVIPHKDPSLAALGGWRKGVWALNRARRFRYTANLPKRQQIQDLRDFKVAVIATQAALLFLGKRFAVTVGQLEGIRGNSELYEKLGGLEGIASKLDVRSLEQGIEGTKADVSERREDFGWNVHYEKPPRGFWVYVWEAFQDLTLVILVICAVISLAFGIAFEGASDGWYDGTGILLTVCIVVFITATSDYKQSLKFQELEKEKEKIKVQVERSGDFEIISIHDVVVGDVVHLSTGDQVPADGIFISGYSLTVDQSRLTGECDPVYPSKCKPFLLSGSMVQNGTGKMLVTAVGMRTEWGKLMSELSEAGNTETPLQVRLNGVATMVGKVGLAFAILTFSVLMIQFLVARFKEGFNQWKLRYFMDILDYFAIAVTILVVAVPEGLPLAVTLSLAYAMKQMIHDKALVRVLSACETMGSATCICSDKTGTLTMNQMAVVKVCCAGIVDEAETMGLMLSKQVLETFLEGIFLNTSGHVVEHNGQYQVFGSPTESSIIELGLSLGGWFDETRSKCEIVNIEPFSSEKKIMSVMIKLSNGKYRTHYKGAPEIILNMCDHRMDNTGLIVPLNVVETQNLKNVIEAFALESLRTICFAFTEFERLPQNENKPPNKGLTFVAIVALKDPIRPEVMNAVKMCVKAGIKVRMITGDNLETAKAIARECNILTEGGMAVEGSEFRFWSLAEKLEYIPKLQVIARSSPNDKLILVRHLKGQQEVVAVTGDGTNDAPALREADIGLAMGVVGTEVAKSSADVILMDDNFSTIVSVVKWGRSVYINIQKFVQFQLTVNVVALTENFCSACITGETTLTIVQLLWVNLIMDTLGALALATEPPNDTLLEKLPLGREGNFITKVMWRNILGQSVYQLCVLWTLEYQAKNLLQLTGNDTDDVVNTVIFNCFVFLQVFNEISSREMEKLNVLKGFLTNKIFLSVILFTIVFQIVIVEFLGNFAGTVPLNARQWAISVLLGFSSLFVAIIIKLIPVTSNPLNSFWEAKSSVNGISNNCYTRLPSGSNEVNTVRP